MRCALYARYSTDLQRGESIDDQFRECERVALAQGFEVVARYSDAGISGGTADRPGYQSLLRDARGKVFDIVLAEDLSRLWRSRAEYGPRSAELEDLGVHIVTAVGDDTRRDGFLILTIKSAIAEHARKETSYRTRRALEGLALAGKSTGGRYYRDVVVVKRIFQRAVEGASPWTIARELNGDRIPGPRGPYWDGNTVKRILASPRYAGKAIWGRTVSQGGAMNSRRKRHVERPGGPLVVRAIEPLVDVSAWEAVNRRAA